MGGGGFHLKKNQRKIERSGGHRSVLEVLINLGTEREREVEIKKLK